MYTYRAFWCNNEFLCFYVRIPLMHVIMYAWLWLGVHGLTFQITEYETPPKLAASCTCSFMQLLREGRSAKHLYWGTRWSIGFHGNKAILFPGATWQHTPFLKPLVTVFYLRSGGGVLMAKIQPLEIVRHLCCTTSTVATAPKHSDSNCWVDVKCTHIILLGRLKRN
jgi:hypothetical protein